MATAHAGARVEVRVVTGPRRTRRLLTVAGAVVAALAVWAAAKALFGIDVRQPAFTATQSPQELSAALVVTASAVGALAGWGALAILEWRTANPRRWWIATSATALVLSISLPLTGSGVAAADRGVLVAMHIAVAAVLIPFLYRSLRRGTDNASE
jgi:hypothetical protein